MDKKDKIIISSTGAGHFYIKANNITFDDYIYVINRAIDNLSELCVCDRSKILEYIKSDK